MFFQFSLGDLDHVFQRLISVGVEKKREKHPNVFPLSQTRWVCCCNVTNRIFRGYVRKLHQKLFRFYHQRCSQSTTDVTKCPTKTSHCVSLSAPASQDVTRGQLRLGRTNLISTVSCSRIFIFWNVEHFYFVKTRGKKKKIYQIKIINTVLKTSQQKWCSSLFRTKQYGRLIHVFMGFLLCFVFFNNWCWSIAFCGKDLKHNSWHVAKLLNYYSNE